MPKQLTNRVLQLDLLAEDIYRLKVESEYISSRAQPGQFVDIKCCEGTDALLRRPISVCTVDRKNGTYDLVFQKKGRGTELLARKKPGERLDVIGPLGKGFDLDIRYGRIAVIGGGIGIFPLLFVLNESRAVVKRAYLGFRSAELVVMEKEFRASSVSLEIATDDGSRGTHGFVTDLLKNDLLSEHFDMIYACGPLPMLRKTAQIAEENSSACEVSMEQRMGCGFGTCLVCACKTHTGENGWQYSHVCKDGPVLNSRDIVFE
ncbi:MAG TPA: dihydroorotate dehydrogenase electron transfer subunit [Clostridia bacterium]|nr:dihydroorotate dehydrogenase electron transfer subunit [Clostridia bacterium]